MIVTTTKGDMDSSLLVRKDEQFENDNEKTTITEYYDKGELVHRSVHIDLKTAIFGNSAIGGL